MSENKLIVTESELSLVENNSLNSRQLSFLLKKTPDKYVKERPAKGGGTWKYVSGGYVRKCLNLMFGWDWDFEILSEKVENGEAIVKGKLTCRLNGRQIVKMQFGNKDVVYKKQSDKDKELGLPREPLSIGNDYKAAATDCLKKCAAEIGIASDIYSKDEFREFEVVDDLENTQDYVEFAKKVLADESIVLTDEDRQAINVSIDTQDEDTLVKVYKRYKKVLKNDR
jgi:hypothetical protein